MKAKLYFLAILAIILNTFPLSVSAELIDFSFVDHRIVTDKGRILPEDKVLLVERNISRLLSAIHKAGKEHAPVDFTGIVISEDGKKDVLEYADLFYSTCLQNSYKTVAIYEPSDRSFEVRGIGVSLELTDSTCKYSGPKERHLAINFRYGGMITQFAPVVDILYMHKGDFTEVTNQERLNTIRKFVENFRQYYEQKDINSLRKIYSDDALIVTGRVMAQKKVKGREFGQGIQNKIAYKKEDKETYLNRLENVTFKYNKYINIGFDDIVIQRCGTKGKTNFYGVSLKQTWDTSTYNDEGYLFLLWEFDDSGKEPPIVHVRAWQPLNINQKQRFSIYDWNF